MDLPERYFQYFSNLDDMFSSADNLQARFKIHLQSKPNDTIDSFVHFHTLTLFDFEIEFWKSSNEERLKIIIQKLKLILENCDQIVGDSMEGVVEYLSKHAGKNKSEIDDFINKIGSQKLAFTSSIDDKVLKEKSIAHYASLLFQRYFNVYIDKFSRILFSANEQSKIASSITWLKSDTDFLELVTALCESKSIDNKSKDLTRKDAIELLSEIFNLEINDAESKLTRACERKNNTSPFLSNLKSTFNDYCQSRENRIKTT